MFRRALYAGLLLSGVHTSAAWAVLQVTASDLRVNGQIIGGFSGADPNEYFEVLTDTAAGSYVLNGSSTRTIAEGSGRSAANTILVLNANSIAGAIALVADVSPDFLFNNGQFQITSGADGAINVSFSIPTPHSFILTGNVRSDNPNTAVGFGNGTFVGTEGSFFFEGDLTAGNYHIGNGNLGLGGVYFPGSQPAQLAQSGRVEFNLQLAEGTTPIGSGQDNPILPMPTLPALPDPIAAIFRGAPSGRWFDPPATSGFEFEMLSASLFTDILNFPSGIDGDGQFEVFVGGLSLGSFSVGQGVNFVDLLGAGVSSFSITGIDPAVDGGNPLAFPIQLAFNTPIADFSMTPIAATAPAATPEPVTAGLLIVGAVTLLWRRTPRHGAR